MMRRNRHIHIALSLVLSLLLIFPSFYQSAHQVWSHHHHFDSMTSSKGFLLDGPEDNCRIVNYVISNSFPGEPVMIQDELFVFLSEIITPLQITLCQSEFRTHEIRGSPYSIA